MKRNKKKFISIFLIATIVLSLFSTNVFATESIIDANEKRYSGEQIFRGVVIGQGEIAKELDGLWNSKNYEKANQAENIKAVDEVLAKMKEEHPTFFQDFEDAIYNKDLKKTEELLIHGSERFIEIMNTEYDTKLSEGEVADANCLVAVLSLVAAFSHAVQITFYLEFVAVGPGFESSMEPTARESLVLDIVEMAN
ncbi:sporulation delaying protein family toxin [Oceanobacillus piezotolerans]|uniref:Sporulation delaying protein family toxin n=1 Tax=Oceanobacillus piezotolerans TaxID=2448030 RepID=A0A498D5V1_9BACI|nr:sporulation delaying protein family toxin [Oceanobacillus piezotolerans]RLL39807.1 sporulation delaying protein family toxin [Oceanobacillus piezotolerans]